MPLTENQAKNAKPLERAYKLADSEGLFLLVQPNGAKLWRMKYRFAGKEKLLSFGAYPALGIAAARERRRAAKAVLAEGRDPMLATPSIFSTAICSAHSEQLRSTLSRLMRSPGTFASQRGQQTGSSPLKNCSATIFSRRLRSARSSVSATSRSALSSACAVAWRLAWSIAIGENRAFDARAVGGLPELVCSFGAGGAKREQHGRAERCTVPAA